MAKLVYWEPFNNKDDEKSRFVEMEHRHEQAKWKNPFKSRERKQQGANTNKKKKQTKKEKVQVGFQRAQS